MKILLTAFILFFNVHTFAQNLTVIPKSSKVDWHIHIKSNTDVYGSVPVKSGNISLDAKNGKIIFDLAATKSFELDDGEKELSEARDERIQSITGSKKKSPIFEILDIETKDENYLVIGKLTLNGVTKKIQVPSNIKQIDGNIYKLQTNYKLMYKNFDVSNPVIWILRATSTPEDFISLKFDIDLEKS